MYLFYLDESGQREYGSGTSRYFVLSAVVIHENQWRTISHAVDELKMNYFKDVRVEIKSNWLRNPKAKKSLYLDKFDIDEIRLSEFGKRVHEIIESSELKILASVIDKIQMQEKYVTPQSPSSRAFIHLFERIELFLKSYDPEEHGLVIFDKINDTNFQRRGYENLLSKQHKRYLLKGTDFVQIDRIIEGLFFIPSSENNLIQLSDLVAYDIYRQFHDHGGEWDDGEVGLKRFCKFYPYFDRIKHLIYASNNGQLDGYGIKKFPEVVSSGK